MISEINREKEAMAQVAPHLVVVDDNELLLKAMGRWLRSELGWESVCFAEPADALIYLQNNRVDLLVVDMRMPQMNGIEFLAQAQVYQEDVIQILMTGHEYHDTVVEAINRLDLFFFMEKPWDPQKFSLVLQRGWERKRLIDTLDQRLVQVEDTFVKLKATQMDLLRHKNQAAIGEMIQGICHNINTPLGVILGHLEMLQVRTRGVEVIETQELQPSLETLYDATSRIRNIIQNLMVKSRLEQVPEKQSLSMDKMIHQEMDFLQAEPFLKHNVEVRLRLGRQVPDLMVNYGDFSQIFGNIVRNALDAMREVDHPCLEICTQLDGEQVILEVHDNGPGIPAELREKIFEPYFTTKEPVEDTQTPVLGEGEKPVGVGLGLYSVTQLLQPYAGQVEVLDSPLGGACFRVILPLSPKQDASNDPTSSGSSTSEAI